MKIAAVTKFKHGGIYELLRKHGITQAELARRTGIHPSGLSAIVRLIRRPSEKQVIAIQRVLGEMGEAIDVEEFFPASYVGTGKSLTMVQLQDVEPLKLAQYAQHQRLTLEDAQMPIAADLLDTETELQRVKDAVSDKELDLLRKYFIEGAPFRELAKQQKITRAGLQHRVENVLKKIRRHLARGQNKPESVRLVKWSDGISRPASGDQWMICTECLGERYCSYEWGEHPCETCRGSGCIIVISSL
jgi:transcriptional regulator with XRE-family HTH domain